MKKIYTVIVCFSFIISSCKTDKKNSTNVNKETQTQNISDDQRLLNSIQEAYNFSKFKKEKQVKFNVKLSVSDTILYNGFLILKPNTPEIRVLGSQIDTILNANSIESDFHKTLFFIAESYALPFWLKPDTFQKESKNDSLVTSDFTSHLTNSHFKISTHPTTHIIEKIAYKTDIKNKPFNEGKLYYDKYITVNRIPVAMKWYLEVNQQVSARVEISRISYPDKF
ncbi:hypothetical protein [Flavobacteriaceae bacterium 14752]|uniref:hypothetical protein n=1 Tax=Mesohalobacter salilacus TaxID=2491711 RepID=UPI000F63A26F|nr:hypothetical protein EIG84_03770 [Flavobacteriaceae bacterium 14752]